MQHLIYFTVLVLAIHTGTENMEPLRVNCIVKPGRSDRAYLVPKEVGFFCKKGEMPSFQ